MFSGFNNSCGRRAQRIIQNRKPFPGSESFRGKKLTEFLDDEHWTATQYYKMVLTWTLTSGCERLFSDER